MTQAVQLASYGSTGQSLGFKNRIINGAMTINQRSGGTVTVNQYFNYITDRWCAFANVNGKYTSAQSSTAPAGFNNSLVATSTSAYALGSSEVFNIGQYIEGYNIADLGWGTSSAKTVTLSFWVQSSLTGTFGGALRNNAEDRSYPFTYTISAANTWQQISITVPGDTSGTWLTTTGVGMRVIFGLGVGSSYSGTAGAWASANYYSATGTVSLVATSGATFYITGVQLEVGATATAFEYRPFGTELRLCQRYFWSGRGAIATGHYLMYNISYTDWLGNFGSFPVTMRATPTMSFTGGNGTNCSSVSVTAQSPDSFSHKTSGGGTGQVGSFAGATYSASSEL